MSDYRFGDDYKLSIYPKDAMDGCGEIDMNKVEAVEIEWVDFIRKPDDKSRWFELFGTSEKAAQTLMKFSPLSCAYCALYGVCGDDQDKDCLLCDYDALLGWLRGEGDQ